MNLMTAKKIVKKVVKRNWTKDKSLSKGQHAAFGQALWYLAGGESSEVKALVEQYEFMLGWSKERYKKIAGKNNGWKEAKRVLVRYQKAIGE